MTSGSHKAFLTDTLASLAILTHASISTEVYTYMLEFDFVFIGALAANEKLFIQMLLYD